MKLIKPAAAILTAAVIGAQLFACGKSDSSSGSYDYSKGLDSNGYFKGVKAAELVTLPQYKGIDIDSSVLVADDAAVQEQVDGVLSKYSSHEQIKDRAVEDGDTINIDYVGSIDGVEFSGGSTGGMGTTVTIGVTNYIDDFLEQLIGHTPGENFDIEVTFPEDYGKDDLNGKDAIFNVTINYIEGELITAELTDEIAADYGFDSVDAMLQDIRDWLIANQKFQVFVGLLEQATCSDIPETVLNYVIDYDLEQYSYYAAMYGVTVEELLIQQMGYESKQAYIDANMEYYVTNATQYLAAQAIAELEGLTVSAADLEEAGYTEFIEDYGEPYLKQYLLFQEVIPDFIVENGNVK